MLFVSILPLHEKINLVSGVRQVHEGYVRRLLLLLLPEGRDGSQGG